MSSEEQERSTDRVSISSDSTWNSFDADVLSVNYCPEMCFIKSSRGILHMWITATNLISNDSYLVIYIYISVNIVQLRQISAPVMRWMRVRGSEVTELDGSSIRAPYTSDRDAEDVLCSGPTRPGRQVSPEDAANAEETF